MKDSIPVGDKCPLDPSNKKLLKISKAEHLAKALNNDISRDSFMTKRKWKSTAKDGVVFLEIDSGLAQIPVSVQISSDEPAAILRFARKYDKPIDLNEVLNLAGEDEKLMRKIWHKTYFGVIKDLRDEGIPEETATKLANVVFLLNGIIHFLNPIVFWSYLPRTIDIENAERDACKLELMTEEGAITELGIEYTLGESRKELKNTLMAIALDQEDFGLELDANGEIEIKRSPTKVMFR